MVGLKEPSLAVILATYNGEGVLPRVLDGFVRCSMAPGFNWRLIVVDNGSTDATAATLDRFSQRLPLTIVGESRPGKNRPLNTALSSLQQTFAAYVFTDDDAIPNPDFLVAWREVIERNPRLRTLRRLGGADVFGAAAALVREAAETFPRNLCRKHAALRRYSGKSNLWSEHGGQGDGDREWISLQ